MMDDLDDGYYEDDYFVRCCCCGKVISVYAMAKVEGGGYTPICIGCLKESGYEPMTVEDFEKGWSL